MSDELLYSEELNSEDELKSDELNSEDELNSDELSPTGLVAAAVVVVGAFVVVGIIDSRRAIMLCASLSSHTCKGVLSHHPAFFCQLILYSISNLAISILSSQQAICREFL